MLFFEDFDHQDRADLEFGGQQPLCERLAELSLEFQDHSVSGDWSPDED